MSFESLINPSATHEPKGLIHVVHSTEKQRIRTLRKAGMAIISVNAPGPDKNKNYQGRRYDELYFFMRKLTIGDDQTPLAAEPAKPTVNEEEYFG